MIRIDPEFEKLIPPLSPEEFAQLEANIVREGIRDPLVIWKVPNGDMILLDGHNRWKISAEHSGIPYQLKEMTFDTREEAKEWILRNQLGRRNLPTYVKAQLALQLKPVIAERAETRMKSGKKDPVLNSAQGSRTLEELGKIANVGKDTIRKVETIENSGDGFMEIKERARNGEISVNKAYGIVTGKDQPPKQKRKKPAKKPPLLESFPEFGKDAEPEEQEEGTEDDLYARCLSACHAFAMLGMDMKDGTVDLRSMFEEMELGKKNLLLNAMRQCRDTILLIMGEAY